MYGNIMIPLDGSPLAERALPVATAIGRRSGGRLHLVRVHVPAISRVLELEAAPASTPGEWESLTRASAEEYLEEMAALLRQRGLDVVTDLEVGVPGATLVKRARTVVDLVVLATHARHGLERTWLGSVADKLIRRTRVPVIAVKEDGREGGWGEPDFRHLVAASDGSPAGEAAVDNAVELARLFGARLTLLRVVTAPSAIASPYVAHSVEADRETLDRREVVAERYLEGMAAQLRSLVGVDTRLLRDYRADRGILRGIAQEEPDLVAIGTRQWRGFQRALLGSVAEAVVRDAPCPVLVAHVHKGRGVRPPVH